MSEHLYDELAALRATLKKEREERKAQTDSLIAGMAALISIIERAPPTLAVSMLAQVPEEQLKVTKRVQEREELKNIVRDLLNSRDAGCGCECHPPYACEWHGPMIKARDILARLS